MGCVTPMPDALCDGCGLPVGHCDCPALWREEDEARWRDAYNHDLNACPGCDGWFPAWALTNGRCAACQEATNG